jgi:hypothetical protein
MIILEGRPFDLDQVEAANPDVEYGGEPCRRGFPVQQRGSTPFQKLYLIDTRNTLRL